VPIVTDPTIRQPGFNLPRHAWSLMNRFHVVLTCTNGVSPSHLPVIVASDRPESTASQRLLHSRNNNNERDVELDAVTAQLVVSF